MIRLATGADRCTKVGVIQNLWSGYGSIERYALEGAPFDSVILKHVKPPTLAKHPRGWNTDLSHARKLKSYQVESNWYQNYAFQCSQHCRVPKCFGVKQNTGEQFIWLEDLDAAGFPGRRRLVDRDELEACLSWLAHFHATFLGVTGDGLWERGTYWHLQTRPDELKILEKEDPKLWQAAGPIDGKLSEARFQTLVHGDAKLANFCFSERDSSVAAVDFQYVGIGCGMKDVAYFLGSCLDEAKCESQAPELLDYYFSQLEFALEGKLPESIVSEMEAEWRSLYVYAWADFHRFLKGWSPGHWKLNGYSERLCQDVIAALR